MPLPPVIIPISGAPAAPGVYRPMEFHVSRKARDRYAFDLSMFSTNGRVIFANFYAARLFSQKINDSIDIATAPEKAVSPADINAMGLIDEILHTIITEYRKRIHPGVFQEALDYMGDRFGEDAVENALLQFVDAFPPLAVYRKEIDVAAYLRAATDGVGNRQIALEEMLLLWLSNLNPAFSRYRELFDDSELREKTVYPRMMTEIETFFDAQPFFGEGKGMNLFHFLRQPALANPASLGEQLRFIHQRWGTYLAGTLQIKWELLLGEGFLDTWGLPSGEYDARLMRTLDFFEEEHRKRFFPGGDNLTTEVPGFFQAEAEPEAFSTDLHWMPRLVLIAKSTLVWLDQLSKKYQRPIHRLDQIPDAELDQLARWGMTGLWLIGIWERSKASKTIKQRCGNPEAESSAYSLYDYQIAAELGGDAAYANLRERAQARGIRLASDMVPNHTGVDSRWMMEHPEWFLQLPYSPFPGYRFNSEDLAHHPDVGLHLEDHYYDRSDAAVVFKRVDRHSGHTRFIYHGNDGTSMPWNDTAQLNYLLPEVREAVIRTIVDVARKFPIIRFDAAMTLAKRHFHRLWFPEPGSGGDIPSRAEHGMTRAEFDRHIPVEFWREVVDRVAQEAPDTLLLAEAFWMMEGYFVRTLGMHRVYNSAFMNMLKNEENQKYRYTIKNTIEFEPEILKRYVNFMNNPDEETAVRQFGDGDKYFGVSVMMSTLPGLPMFGHGQFEGLHEKYGMEYRRAYYDEHPNAYMIARHEREIVPLLKRRHLFAEVEHFLLYDFFSQSGEVDENVFAYSNRHGEERSLVVFNNRFGDTRGWIRMSAAFAEKLEHGRGLAQRSLGQGLALDAADNAYSIVRNSITGMEHLFHNRTLMDKGLYLELGAYHYRVFVDFRQVHDHDGRLGQLHQAIGGGGVPSVEEALRELHLRPLHDAFRVVMDAPALTRAEAMLTDPERNEPDPALLDDLCDQYRTFLQTARSFSDLQGDIDRVTERARGTLSAALRMDPATLATQFPRPASRRYPAALANLSDTLANPRFTLGVMWSWALTSPLGELTGPGLAAGSGAERAVARMDEWMLDKIARRALEAFGLRADESETALRLTRLLLELPGGFRTTRAPRRQAHATLDTWLRNEDFRRFVGVNRFDGVLYFNREGFDGAIRWLFAGSVAERLATDDRDLDGIARHIAGAYQLVELWFAARDASEYRLETLLTAVKGPKGTAGGATKASRKSTAASTRKRRAAKTPSDEKAKKTSPARKTGSKDTPGGGKKSGSSAKTGSGRKRSPGKRTDDTDS